MKNTKTIIISIVSLLVLVGIIGATSALLIGSLKKANEMLDDAMGELIMGEDTTSPEGTETGSEPAAPSAPADPWADGKLTYADGELDIGYRINTGAGYSGYSVFSEELKPDTKYIATWNIKTTYPSYGFYVDYDEEGGANVPYIILSLDVAFSNKFDLYHDKGSEAGCMNSYHYFTTDSNGYAEFMFLRSSDVSNEACLENREIFKSLIVSFEIEEVS